MSVTRIYVGRERLEQGEPCIAVHAGSSVQWGQHVYIDGPSEVVFDERGMLGRPIKAWIETEARVRVS